MHTARLFAALAFVAAAVAACQSLIALGDEPVLGCGIARAPGPACAHCLESRCCEASFACSRDSVCKAAAETCLVNCFDAPCITACLHMYEGNEALDAYFKCASGCPEECTPDGSCDLLKDCCPKVAGTTLHEGCIRNARSENQELCVDSLELLECDGQGGAAGQ